MRSRVNAFLRVGECSGGLSSVRVVVGGEGANRGSVVTLAGYCVHSTLVPAIVPILFFPPTEQIDYKGKFSSNGRRCFGKRRKEGS